MKHIAGIIFFSLVFLFSTAQKPDGEGSLVKWMTLEEAMKKEEVMPRPILMDFYTDWCGWCKQMMKTTYSRPELSQYINANFYPVKFNAETKDTIDFLGETYRPISMDAKATHPLANKLMQGKLMYPTTLFMNNYDKQKKTFVFNMMAQGYLEENKMEPILIFTLENVFRNSSYDDFKVQFDKAFNSPDAEKKEKEIGWEKPADVFGKKDSNSKKTLVLVGTGWCNGCKVMKRTSFNDSLTDKYLKEKFELVDFDPQSNDTIFFKGKTYINTHSPQMPFHPLAVQLCRNSLTLPTLVVLDNKYNVIDAIPFYLNPLALRDIAVFYGDDIFKTKTWNEYMAGIGKQ